MHKETVDVLYLQVVGVSWLDFNDSPLHRVVENHLKRDLEKLFLVFKFFCHQRSVVCYQAVEYLTCEAPVAQPCG